jgi:hypothetical protein
VWTVFQHTPIKRIYAFNDESCHGGKRNEDKINVFVYANMDGPENIPLLVTRNLEKPWCFKYVKSSP